MYECDVCVGVERLVQSYFLKLRSNTCQNRALIIVNICTFELKPKQKESGTEETEP